MTKNSNLRKNIAKGVLLVGGLAGAVALSLRRQEINPLGYGDINRNGTTDVVVTMPYDRLQDALTGIPFERQKLGFFDGKDITKDENGTLVARVNTFHPFELEENALHHGMPLILIRKPREGETTFAQITTDTCNPDWTNLSLYTTFDVEPGVGQKTYQQIGWH